MAIELRSTRLDMLPLAQLASARQPALSASRRKERLNWPLPPNSLILPPRRVRTRDLAPSRWETLEKQYRAGQCGWGKLQLEILRVTERSQPRRIIRPSASLPSLCSQISRAPPQMSALGHVWTAPWQKLFWRCCSIGRVWSRVRPVDAARLAAGPNALRGSGPKH